MKPLLLVAAILLACLRSAISLAVGMPSSVSSPVSSSVSSALPLSVSSSVPSWNDADNSTEPGCGLICMRRLFYQMAYHSATIGIDQAMTAYDSKSWCLSDDNVDWCPNSIKSTVSAIAARAVKRTQVPLNDSDAVNLLTRLAEITTDAVIDGMLWASLAVNSTSIKHNETWHNVTRSQKSAAVLELDRKIWQLNQTGRFVNITDPAALQASMDSFQVTFLDSDQADPDLPANDTSDSGKALSVRDGTPASPQRDNHISTSGIILDTSMALGGVLGVTGFMRCARTAAHGRYLPMHIMKQLEEIPKPEPRPIPEALPIPEGLPGPEAEPGLGPDNRGWAPKDLLGIDPQPWHPKRGLGCSPVTPCKLLGSCGFGPKALRVYRPLQWIKSIGSDILPKWNWLRHLMRGAREFGSGELNADGTQFDNFNEWMNERLAPEANAPFEPPPDAPAWQPESLRPLQSEYAESEIVDLWRHETFNPETGETDCTPMQYAPEIEDDIIDATRTDPFTEVEKTYELPRMPQSLKDQGYKPFRPLNEAGQPWKSNGKEIIRYMRPEDLHPMSSAPNSNNWRTLGRTDLAQLVEAGEPAVNSFGEPIIAIETGAEGAPAFQLQSLVPALAVGEAGPSNMASYMLRGANGALKVAFDDSPERIVFDARRPPSIIKDFSTKQLSDSGSDSWDDPSPDDQKDPEKWPEPEESTEDDEPDTDDPKHLEDPAIDPHDETKPDDDDWEDGSPVEEPDDPISAAATSMPATTVAPTTAPTATVSVEPRLSATTAKDVVTTVGPTSAQTKGPGDAQTTAASHSKAEQHTPTASRPSIAVSSAPGASTISSLSRPSSAGSSFASVSAALSSAPVFSSTSVSAALSSASTSDALSSFSSFSSAPASATTSLSTATSPSPSPTDGSIPYECTESWAIKNGLRSNPGFCHVCQDLSGNVGTCPEPVASTFLTVTKRPTPLTVPFSTKTVGDGGRLSWTTAAARPTDVPYKCTDSWRLANDPMGDVPKHCDECWAGDKAACAKVH